jgi:hypothetical protein
MKELTTAQKTQIVNAIRRIVGDDTQRNLAPVFWQLLKDEILKTRKSRRRKRLYWLMDSTIAFFKKVFAEFEK